MSICYYTANQQCYPKKGEYDQFSVSKLINNLQWDTLEKRRNNAKMVMTYKIVNNKVIVSPSTLPIENKARLRNCNVPTVGKKWQLTEPHSNILTSGNTFFYVAPKLWNRHVTPEQAESPSVDAFKNKFSK